MIFNCAIIRVGASSAKNFEVLHKWRSVCIDAEKVMEYNWWYDDNISEMSEEWLRL